MSTDYIWRKLRSEAILRTPHYGVTRDRLRHPQGHELDYYVIEYPRAAVGVVPINSEHRLLLVQQWRHPVQKLTWSVPAGLMEEGETPEQAAVRELREETGYSARAMRPLYRYHPAIGTSNQTFHLFVASGLESIGRRDPREIHAAEWFSVPQVQDMLEKNEMVDGLSLTALLLWLRQECR